MLEAHAVQTAVGPDRPIDRYFRRKGFRTKLQASFFAPYWDGFIESMERRGYCRYTTYRTIEIALPLSAHAAVMGLGVADLTDEIVERYLRVQRHRASR
jgi:hypothetical protein